MPRTPTNPAENDHNLGVSVELAKEEAELILKNLCSIGYKGLLYNVPLSDITCSPRCGVLHKWADSSHDVHHDCTYIHPSSALHAGTTTSPSWPNQILGYRSTMASNPTPVSGTEVKSLDTANDEAQASPPPNLQRLTQKCHGTIVERSPMPLGNIGLQPGHSRTRPKRGHGTSHPMLRCM